MSDMTAGDANYRRTLHRWNELMILHLARGLSDAENRELAALAAALERAELAHRQEQSAIEMVSSDYDQLGEIGHLGGTEEELWRGYFDL